MRVSQVDSVVILIIAVAILILFIIFLAGISTNGFGLLEAINDTLGGL